MSRIPNRFHFVFGMKEQTEPFHLLHYLCLESCLRVNRPEAVHFYYHYEPYGEYWQRIRDRIAPEKVELVPTVSKFRYDDPVVGIYSYAHHSDFVRLERLGARGGVYADMDTLFVNPLPAPLFEKPFVLGWEDPVRSETTGLVEPSVCNAFIMSERGAEFGARWHGEMASAMDGSWSGHSCRLARQLAERHPDLVHLEPSRSFYKHMWTREGIATLFEGCDLDCAGVYSLHLWSHLWWSVQRRDFTRVHAGRFTEDYIRYVDTTYNVLARRFLPDPPPRWAGLRRPLARARERARRMFPAGR